MKLRVTLTGLILVGLLSAFPGVANQQTRSKVPGNQKFSPNTGKAMKEKVPFERTITFASAVNQKDDDWTYIGTSKEGVKLYYSPERMVKRGRLIQAWFKGEYPDADQEISSNISLHEFNCPKGTYRLLQGTLFFRDGSARSSNQPSAWEHPLPDSVAEMEFKQVCRKTSSRKNDVR
jgi:hypothetical protein